jgi:hypothetical protein
MTDKTKHEKLTEWVKAGLDGGASLNVFLVETQKKARIRDWYISIDKELRVEVSYYEANAQHSSICSTHITIPRFTSNPEFMIMVKKGCVTILYTVIKIGILEVQLEPHLKNQLISTMPTKRSIL